MAPRRRLRGNVSTETFPARSTKPRFILPLVVFVILVLLLGVGLTLNPREVPSPLVGKPAPQFELPLLHAPERTFSPKDMLGKVWMLNVWASWCVSCRHEHPVLVELAKSGALPIYGLNYKDARAEGIAWLERYGDPYRLSAYDAKGVVGIDYGVYGVPESYVIDKRGVIRYKQIGIVTPEVLRTKIMPLVRELERNG
jgi:cytochrome c biogenesis protein CcmG/thiol:disulfide interchange protein DsbE